MYCSGAEWIHKEIVSDKHWIIETVLKSIYFTCALCKDPRDELSFQYLNDGIAYNW